MRRVFEFAISLILFVVVFIAGLYVGRHSPCADVDQTIMLKIPPEEAP